MHTSLTMTHRSLAPQPVLEVLRLIRTLNVGPMTFFHLIERFGTARRALEALPELSLRGGRAKPLIPYSREDAERELDAVHKFGAKMIMYGEPDYPELLHAISDPPPIITVCGHTHLWKSKPLLAMVGSRNASANGCAFAQKLARELGEDGLVIVSGLARGIDSFAHRGSLATGTIGVIAGGIDNIYPPENEILFRQLRETGAIISEQPFGSLPFSGSFPGRNRIIAGMAAGSLIVEASPKSGSLITARFALDYGREVFAVPGSPLDPRAKGCNGLIKDGAIMVESAADVLQNITHLRGKRLEESAAPTPPVLAEASLPQEDELAQARTLLLEKLSPTPVNLDTVIMQALLPSGVILAALLELELGGCIQRLPGNRVCLTASSALQTAMAE